MSLSVELLPDKKLERGHATTRNLGGVAMWIIKKIFDGQLENAMCLNCPWKTVHFTMILGTPCLSQNQA